MRLDISVPLFLLTMLTTNGFGFLPKNAAFRTPGLPPTTSLSVTSSEVQNTLECENSLQEFILSRRTINDFESELPDGWEASLERAVELATYAPNHKRTEPWRFHLLGEKSIQNVCELNSEIITKKKGKEKGEAKLKRWLSIPGWLVVTCKSSPTSTMDDPAGMAREDYAACCCAVQNLSLSLHSEGLGTKWTTGAVNFDDRFASAAGIPSDEYVVGTIWFGKAAKTPPTPQKKLSIDEVFRKQE